MIPSWLLLVFYVIAGVLLAFALLQLIQNWSLKDPDDYVSPARTTPSTPTDSSERSPELSPQEEVPVYSSSSSPPEASLPTKPPETPSSTESNEPVRTSEENIADQQTDKPVTKPAVTYHVEESSPYSISPMSQQSRQEELSLEAGDLEITGTDDYIFGPNTPMLASMLPESEPRRVDLKKSLKEAGFYEPHAYENINAVRYLGLIIPLFLLGMLLIFVPESFEPIVIVLLLFMCALGYELPRLIVKSRAKERLRQIEHAMPDMLDMLNMCVSQGLTVPQGLGRIGREMKPVYPALSQELGIVTAQTRLGTLDQALKNFGQRIDVPEVHSFVSLVTQTEKMGTSVSDALVDYSDNMRESLRQRADEKANRATFWLLLPTVFCLMPAVYLFLLGPAIVEYREFMDGGGAQVLENNAQSATEFGASRNRLQRLGRN